MREFKKVLLVALCFVGVTIMAQTKITGTVVDNFDMPLPGASVLLKGTVNGTSTDFNGKFALDAEQKSGSIVIVFVGYEKQELVFNGTTDFGTIKLKEDGELDEIVVTATSYAIDRKTPVAVSTIKGADIERKLGNQEFPEVLKSTPGVYVTRAGGGFGDGEIRMRGFGSVNVAVMINGVPVNDMENGRVYWSNWAGLGDVTSSMQTQRGLGASKVAVPSIGGTINIITKSTDAEKGGTFAYGLGNDGYQKYGMTLSTGKLDNGFAATVSAAKVSGNGFVDGTEFNGWNYFANLSYELDDSHTIALTTFGAPQRHGQRQNRSTIQEYREAESGIRFNPDWGYKNGQVLHVEDNFYHKNQTSLNHYWTISDRSSLSTAAYFSIGTGGGGGTAGDETVFSESTDYRLGGYDQPYDIDAIVDRNILSNKGVGAETILRASRNDHNWYGVLSTFKTEISETLNIVAGLDVRQYKGIHFREVTDLLGGGYFLDLDDEGVDNNVNNETPKARKVGDKMGYYNDGVVGWQGFFTQIEYSGEKIDAFISSSTSNTSYKRIDYFNYKDDDPLQESDSYNFVGFGVKGGLNYRLDGIHNVFGNVGYFERAPIFNSVFYNFNNEEVNEFAENEKIFSAELGYGLRSEKLAANLNVYRTEWNDRTLQRNVNAGGDDQRVNILGVDALHQGVEFDFTWRPKDFLTVTGMGSIGDWTWSNNLMDANVFDENQNLVGNVDLLIKGTRVADAAQTTAALGALYKFWDDTSITLDYNYFGDIWSDFNFEDGVNLTEVGKDKKETTATQTPWKMPDYHTLDGTVRHGFKIGELDTTVTLRVNNIFDTEYISDAQDVDGTAEEALVWYGAGRTFSLGAKIRF